MINDMYSDKSSIASFLGWSNFEVLKFWTNYDDGDVQVDTEGNGDFTTIGGIPPSNKSSFKKQKDYDYSCHEPLPDIKDDSKSCLMTIKKLMSMGTYVAPNHNGGFEVRSFDSCKNIEFASIEDAIINAVKELNIKKAKL